MEQPKVSIISIFYNREDTVKDSVESLVNQTYDNLEIILIDDNSSDSTLERLKEFAEKNDKVRVIHNAPNKGFTNSLVDTIATLDSKYVAIHGSGDISYEERVSRQVDLLERKQDVGAVSVGVVNRPVNNVSDKEMIITTDHLLKRNMINHGTVMFRMETYKKVGGYRRYFKYRQDKDLWYRMSLVSKLYFLPEKLYHWTVQEKSVTKSTSANYEPTLVSEFATFLIKERMLLGYDSLDRDGDKAALLFNPVSCKHIFHKNLKAYIRRKEWGAAIATIELLIKISEGFFYKKALLSMKLVLEKIVIKNKSL